MLAAVVGWISFGIRSAVFVCLVAGASAALGQAQKDKYTTKDRFYLRHGEVKVAFDPASAFTVPQVTVNGHDLIVTVGFGGFTMAYPGMQWVGSGHTEGGREEVLEVRLEVDGKLVELPLGETLDVESSAILRKTSRLREDVTLRTETRFTDGVLQEIIDVEFHNPELLEYVYPFMFCWSPRSERWMAETTGGEFLEGMFDSDGSWKLAKDVRWTSVYFPEYSAGALVVFSADLPPGQGRKHAFWDLDRYHKQYYQLVHSAELPVGMSLKLSATLHFFNALNEAEWKENASHLAQQPRG